MTERGTDIDFDFFDEPETEEAAPRRVVRATRGPRPPVRPPAGFTPLLRLVGLIAFAILVVVLLIFWVQSCRSENKRDTYADYMEDVRVLASDSEQVGNELNRVLTTPGIRQADLQSQLSGLAQQQQQGVARAQELEPPGRLRAEHQNLVEALELRVAGLRRLQAAFRRTESVQQAASAGALLSAQAQRLLASDIMWDDLFREPSIAELRQQEIRGVDVPDSTFLANADLATQRGMTPVFQRIRGAATGGTPGGRHGNALVSVRALPGGTVLQQGAENTVVATADLAFEVTLENQGDSQEVQVKVNLTVEQSPQPIRRQQVVDVINEGESKRVVFGKLGQIVQFAQKTTVRVEVQPVRGERTVTNNRASYPVIFTLTPPS